MTLSMYTLTVPVFVRYLTNLRAVLEKADAYAGEKKIKPEVFGQSRLAPDMNPLTFQIQSSTDRPKLALARLTGRTPPVWEDNEVSIADMQARIDKAIEHFRSYTAADIDGTDNKMLTVRARGQDVQVSGEEHLLYNVVPQFYFHVTTAYDIIRHAGVPIGKRDFLGPV